MLKPAILISLCLLFVVCSPWLVGEAFPITFSTNEDYDIVMYGTLEGLKEVEEDFKLVKELGLSRLRVSFSWINYQPEPGQFSNLDWLHQFVDLAQEYNITLMPYLCYTPYWAAKTGQWNDPLKNYDDWYNYVYKMASEFRDEIYYWEIWNEEDSKQWFNGTKEEFAKLVNVGSEAIRKANPEANVILGGLTWGEQKDDFVEYIIENCPGAIDIVAVHCYAESWNPSYLEDSWRPGWSEFDSIARILENKAEGQPIWVNEIGYPTVNGRTEQDQASYIRRAVATILASEKVSLISWYEIKDLEQDNPIGVIGDYFNYHLGLTDSKRNKKLGFYTYQNIIALLNEKELDYLETVSYQTKKEDQNSYSSLRIYVHPFQRVDDKHIILFAWLYGPAEEVFIDIELPGIINSISEYSFKGEESSCNNFNQSQMKNVQLVRDKPRLFEIILNDNYTE